MDCIEDVRLTESVELTGHRPITTLLDLPSDCVHSGRIETLDEFRYRNLVPLRTCAIEARDANRIQ